MHTRKLIAAALALAAASCASPSTEGVDWSSNTTARSMPLGDGSSAWLVDCSGGLNTIAGCYKRAAALCPNGFTPLQADQRTSGGAVIANPLGGYSVIQGEQRQLLVTCKL